MSEAFARFRKKIEMIDMDIKGLPIVIFERTVVAHIYETNFGCVFRICCAACLALEKLASASKPSGPTQSPNRIILVIKYFSIGLVVVILAHVIEAIVAIFYDDDCCFYSHSVLLCCMDFFNTLCLLVKKTGAIMQEPL